MTTAFAGTRRTGHARPHTAVEVRGITKRFFGKPANEEVDFGLDWGEVHALLGENGAGKSTLCSILAGLFRPDSGEIFVDGEPCVLRNPAEALERGVGMVYQHYRLVKRFTAAENIVLGHPDTPRMVRRGELERLAEGVMRRFGMEVDPSATVDDLTVGEQQRVEILKLLHRDVRVLILDEPTAVLTPQEKETLFAAVRSLAADGRAVVFISHKLNEVLEVSDRITVMRHGRAVETLDAASATRAELARMMVRRDPEAGPLADDASRAVETETAAAPAPEEPVLRVRDLDVKDFGGRPAVFAASFDVRPGEVVGLAGVAGNGQRELAEAIAGVLAAERGSVELAGSDITHATARERVAAGLAFVPEDRLATGVAAGLPLDANLVLRDFWRRPFSRFGVLRRGAIARTRRELVERFDIRGGAHGLPVATLSGGNIQRVILARELRSRPRALLAASPTRGLDVAGIERVRELLLEQCAAGVGVLLISEDLDELVELADRLLVIFEGRIVAELPTREASAERLGLLMAGLTES
jgi:ABC-type uncharacterized transport system ATPase subunit